MMVGSILMIYKRRKEKNIRGEFKADWENSRNISEVGIIDFDNIFWFKPKIKEINENSKGAERKRKLKWSKRGSG